MQHSDNPYEPPRPSQPITVMPVAGMAPGTIDQREAFPENSIVELRRWKQHINSLKIFSLAQILAVLVCLGVGVAISLRSDPNNAFYLAGTALTFVLAILSMIGALTRPAWAVPLIWFWIGCWGLVGIGGVVAAIYFKSNEAFAGVIQIVAYVVILVVFVGKALREGGRYFGPNRINEHALSEELAYREMNSIP